MPFDVDAVVRDLRARLHPNAEFLEAVLTGQRPQRVRPPVIVIVGGLIYFPMLILGPIGERIVG